MDRLEKANIFVRENKNKSKCKPKYHLAPPIGWMNDPNGFCYYNGEYHLFYQYNPYDVIWDDIHWGHAVSEDLINWKHRRVVMACDRMYDISGCFSGSAIEKNGELYLIYTGHIDPNMGYTPINSEIVQQQCLAKYNRDGTVDKVCENPVITGASLPEGYKERDFRDPKVFYKEGYYYTVLAVRNEEDRGSILLYRSQELTTWEFVADIYRFPKDDNILFECPDLFTIDGKDFLVLSLMPCLEEFKHEVESKVVYITGNMNYARGVFEEESRGVLDSGSNYYAPQTTQDKDGNRVIVGWMCEWSDINRKFVESYAYNGMMTIPRKISYQDGELCQTPVDDIIKYQSEVFHLENFLLNEKFTFERDLTEQHIQIIANKFSEILTIRVKEKGSKSFTFVLNPEESTLSMKSSYTVKVDKEITLDYKCRAKIDIFVDTNSVELFVNGSVFSFLCYDDDKGDVVSISSVNALNICSMIQNGIEGVEIE